MEGKAAVPAHHQDLDLNRLDEFPVKVLQAYCKANDLMVRGTNKSDYVKAILANASSPEVHPPTGSRKHKDKGEERRKKEEQERWQQWKAQMQNDMARTAQEQQEERKRREEAQDMLNSKCEIYEEEKKKKTRRLEEVSTLKKANWTLERENFLTQVSDIQKQPSSYLHLLPESVWNKLYKTIESNLHPKGIIKQYEITTPAVSQALKFVNSHRMDKGKKRISMLIVRTEKANNSYFSSPEFLNLSQKDKEKKMKEQKTTLWLGNVEGRISIYKVTGEAQSIWSSGSEKKTTSTLNVKKTRRLQHAVEGSVVQMIQVGNNVWSAGRGPLQIWDIKSYNQLNKNGGDPSNRVNILVEWARLIFVGHEDGTIAAWHASQLTCIWEYQISNEKIYGACVTEGDYFWVSTSAGIRVYHISKAVACSLSEGRKPLSPLLHQVCFYPSKNPFQVLLSSKFKNPSTGVGRVWAATKSSITIFAHSAEGGMIRPQIKMSGGGAFPVQCMIEVGDCILTCGSEQTRIVQWDPQYLVYVGEVKVSWRQKFYALSLGNTFPNQQDKKTTIWSIDSHYLALWAC